MKRKENCRRYQKRRQLLKARNSPFAFAFCLLPVISDGHYSNENRGNEEPENIHFSMTSPICSQLSYVTKIYVIPNENLYRKYLISLSLWPHTFVWHPLFPPLLINDNRKGSSLITPTRSQSQKSLILFILYIQGLVFFFFTNSARFSDTFRHHNDH